MNENLASLKDILKGELYTDDLHKIIYSTDASVYRELPLAVVVPRDQDDIIKVVKFCNAHKYPIIPRAAGTSLAGQCVGSGIILDVSKYMNNIIELDTQARTVTVEPGVIRDELNAFLEPHGLFFGPNTSTANRAMIGGMVGNNSCGTTSISYGVTRDYVIETEVILADGSKAVFKERSISDALAIAKSDSLEGRIYAQAIDMARDQSLLKEVKTKFPKASIHRRNTGYAIDLMLKDMSHNSLNLNKILCGSEGTLAIATKIKLALDPVPPPYESLLCIHFKDVLECMSAVKYIMDFKPYACELMDKTVLDCTKGHIQFEKDRFFLVGDPQAVLMVSFRASHISLAEEQLKQVVNLLKDHNLGYAYPIISTDVERIWDLRKAGLGLLANKSGDKAAVACIEDTAVDVEDLDNYIKEFKELMERFGQKAVYYAHAGAGELHLRPILNLKDAADRKDFYEISKASAKLVKKYQGSLSGEHGDGRVRAPFIELMYGERIYQRFQEIKSEWDINGILNPGKIVHPKSMVSDLRYEENQPDKSYETIFDFSRSKGILRAAEKCNGSGDCRKLPMAGGTMCPSYQATRDEKDTTRARANVIREILTRSNLDNPFDAEELSEVLDLCLSCKGCTAECPSNVNMTMLKAEVLYQKYKDKGFPLRARLFAGVDSVNKVSGRFSRIFNKLKDGNPVSRMLKSGIGIHPDRSLPEVAHRSLRSLLPTRKTSSGKRKKVYLFVDEFTNYNDVRQGQAALELLEALGYKVLIVDHDQSGRAAMSKGMLHLAKEYAQKNVRIFADLVSHEVPLIGVEPSAILSFRDEYPLLVDENWKEQAQELSKSTFTVEEFIYRELKSGNISPEQFHEEKKVIHLHGHCHQKALCDINEVAWILSLPKNYDVQIIPSGCCGMAGSFGYEKEHYEISMKVGETTLFPYLRNITPDALIAASGTSCRHQIKDGVRKRAFHPVEILRAALID